MAVVRKKQDDKCLEALRDLINTGGNGNGGGSGNGGGGGGGGGNRQCFDCGQRGPTYVNMTIGSFVCTRCSGVLRGLTPPHRVKSISMATFTAKEIEFLKSHGNDVCAKTWLGLWDPKRVVPQDQRDLMIDKYERKRYYLEPASPLKALTNTTSVKSSIAIANNNNNRSNINNNQNGQNNVQLNGPSNLQRTTANGLHNTITNGGAGAAAAPIKPINHIINRPQSQYQQNQQSMKSNHMLQENGNSQNNGHQHQPLTDAFGLTNGISGTNTTAGNKFHTEISNSDFVADFNLANIFNATAYKMKSTTTSGTTITTGTTTTATITANSNAKVQSIKEEANKINFLNNNNNNNYHQLNGSGITLNTNANNGPTENFADFEHAPIIYNAPGLTTTKTILNENKGDFSKNFNNNIKSITAVATPSEDRYAALKDLDDQLRESKAAAAAAVAAAAAASIMNNNLINPCNNIYNGNNNNNNNNNNNHNNTNSNGINPFDNITQEQQQQQQQLYNPFKNLNGTRAMPATMNNNNNNNTTNGHLFGQMALIPHNMAATATSATAATTTNGFMGTQKSQINRNFFNYTTPPIATTKANGYHNHHLHHHHHHHHAFITNNNDEMMMNYCNGGGSINFENDDGVGVGVGGGGSSNGTIGSLYNGSNSTTTALNNFFYCPLTKRMAAAAAATTGNNPFATTNAIQSNNPFL